MWRKKDFVLLFFSSLIMAVGIYFFKFPNHFNFGGVTGIAVLAEKSGLLSASDFNFLFSIVFLVLGFIFSGKSFGVKTVCVTLCNSALISLFQRIFPLDGPLTNEPMIELIFAIALPAVAAAMLFHIHASGGGTDIIAVIIQKYTHVDIGKALFFTDLIICLGSFFLFDTKTGLLSFLGLAVKSLVIDSAMEDMNLCKSFSIICSDPEPICDYIIHELHRSATVCPAKGAFSNEEKHVILTVLSRREAGRLRRFIHGSEEPTFLFISKTSEIEGKGFHA